MFWLLCFALLGLIGTLTHRNSDSTSGLFSADIYVQKQRFEYFNPVGVEILERLLAV